MYRGVLICLMTIAFVAGPMAQFGFCGRNRLQSGNSAITSVPPKVLYSAEKQLPKAKKKGAGTYILMGVLGAALVALAAGGGGGGSSSSAPADSGDVEVSW